MQFRAEADIDLLPAHVFEYLRDMGLQQRDERSVVPVLEKTSAGPVGVGATYREVVRVLPNRNAEVHSEVTRFEPPSHLDYKFSWEMGKAHMDGVLRYEVHSRPDGGTHLVQEQILQPHGAFRLLAPYIRWSFMRHLQSRMQELKKEAEARTYAQA